MNEFIGNSKDSIERIDKGGFGLNPNTSSLHNLKIVEDDSLNEDSQD